MTYSTILYYSILCRHGRSGDKQANSGAVMEAMQQQIGAPPKIISVRSTHNDNDTTNNDNNANDNTLCLY